MAAGFVEKVSEQVSFAAKVPMLMKATSDNETPTPGYLYKEINQITFESISNCQLVVKYLNERLKKSSPHVKYKALKIMTYLSANGQSEFRSSLRHQSEQIRQTASFSGDINPLHGDALNQKVRKSATELIELLFNIENPESAQQSFIMGGPTGKKMDGFGNIPLQTAKNTTILDTVKNLTSQIPALSGYLQTKQDFVSSQSSYHGSKSMAPCLTGNGCSPVKFVNYHDTEGTKPSRTQFTGDVMSNEDNDDLSTSNNYDDNKDGEGRLESQLVDKITEEGGVRTVPSRQSLDEFTQKCKSLDINSVLQFLNTKLDEPTLDVQMKSLHALEHLLRSGLPDIADKVLTNCSTLQLIIDTETGKLKSKANKVLHTAKSQSSGLSTVSGNLCEEAPRPKVQENNLIEDLLGGDLFHSTASQPTQGSHNDNGNIDIFQGLQITEEGGVRTVPSRQSLDEFTQKCKSLDINSVLQFLNTKLDEPTLDVQMKSLHALEHLLRSGLPDIADKVLTNCSTLQLIIDTETGKLKSKANKVLHTAKSQSSGLSTVSGNLCEEAPRPKVQENNLIEDLLGGDLFHSTASQPTQGSHNDNGNIDIFQGLQVHSSQDRTPSTQDNSDLSDFGLLNITGDSKPHNNKENGCKQTEIFDLSDFGLLSIAGDSKPHSNKENGCKQTEIFDPLEMGFVDSTATHGTRKTMNNVVELHGGSLIPSLSEQKPLESIKNSTSNRTENIMNEQTNKSVITTKTEKNKPFIDLVDFEQTGQSCTAMSGCQGNQTLTGQSSLSGQVGFGVGPTSVPGSLMFNQNQQPGLASQTGLTGQSGLPSIAPVNPMLQSLLMHKTSQHSTIPLNLANPSSQRTDFEFLTKSKKEKAFSFVQDEMKASKK